MYKPWLDFERFQHIPLEKLDSFAKLHTKDLTTFHFSDFNYYYSEAISWNNAHAGTTNTEIRFRLEEGSQLMTAYLYRFGM